jgi:RNA-directed DNA polymerase
MSGTSRISREAYVRFCEGLGVQIPGSTRQLHRPTHHFRRIRSQRGVWCAHYTPKLKKRTALLRKLKGMFRRYQSQPVDRVIYLINPVLRGWVNYFAVGNSGECFSFIQDWVEKKVRRHMLRARKRKGFGWTRWSRQWL